MVSWYSGLMNTGHDERAKTRVLLFSDRTLFARGIKDMLHQERNLQILGWETDPSRALQSIAQIHPDAVIVATWNAANEFAPAVMTVLRRDPAIKVVEVNLESNTLFIYGKELRVVREVKDLLEAIQQSAAPKNEPPADVFDLPG